MKLKSFNATNTKAVRYGKPTVNVSKSGVFNFSKTASELIMLELTPYIEILQDEERPKDWYVKLSTMEKGFSARKYKEGNNVTNSAFTARQLLKSIGFTGNSVSFLIAGKPTKLEGELLWPILTASANK